ncbi:hypothetical protein D3C80_1782500 [compost metagenome]
MRTDSGGEQIVVTFIHFKSSDAGIVFATNPFEPQCVLGILFFDLFYDETSGGDRFKSLHCPFSVKLDAAICHPNDGVGSLNEINHDDVCVLSTCFKYLCSYGVVMLQVNRASCISGGCT